MSDEEENTSGHYGFYGKALEPLDEDSIPKRKPISVEDQIATDAQGRRRFHGAFTGGFSAGFFNTVGSLEGWRPSEFKSSRSEKALNRSQRPEDYMDDEDMGEFGIAPQKIKATKDFNTSKKRTKQVFADGPIPGEPVLHTLIEGGNDTIGYLLLRNMGYKHDKNGEEDDEEDEVKASQEKIYGCEMPKALRNAKTLEVSLPEEYKALLNRPKTDSFGMGYSGLDRTHVNLFTSTKLVVKESNNKKLSISGQAFGVGAFEEDDEDIYVKEDLTRYDFELAGEKSAKERKQVPSSQLFLDLFVKSRAEYRQVEVFPPPTIPASFTGKYRIKKSRFEPIEHEKQVMNANVRGELLGETSKVQVKKSQEKSKNQSREESEKLDEPKRVTKFDVASASGLIFDKFVSAGKSEEHTEILQSVERMETQHGTKEMREAAKMKQFGVLTRTEITWIPNSLVCKRFNVPEPALSDKNDSKAAIRRHRNLIFENAHVLEETTTSKCAPNFSAGLTKVDPVTKVTPCNASAADEQQPAEKQNADNTAMSRQEVSTRAQKAIDPSERLDISKNVDLFKAVFMDSDSDVEEVEEEVAQETQARHLEMRDKMLADDLLLPQIKPIKAGILSNVECVMTADEMQTTPSKEAIDEITEVRTSADLYGPLLPTKITYRRPGLLTQQQDADKAHSSDDWVEKDDCEGDEAAALDDNDDKVLQNTRRKRKMKEKHRHPKKHKKERQKQSKDKHKHKRKK